MAQFRSATRRHVRRRRRLPRGGFTLVEVMTAMIVVVIGMLAVFNLILMAIQVDSESGHYSVARAIAQRQLEIIRTNTWSSMPTSGTIVGVSSLLPRGSGTITVTALNGQYDTGLDRVTIIVTWKEAGKNATDTVTIDTYICDGGIDAH